MTLRSDDRASFVARVSVALGRPAPVAPPEPPPAVDQAVARVTAATDDLLEIFAQTATASGMIVHRTRAADLEANVVALAESLGARRIAVADTPALAGITSALGRIGAELLRGWDVPGFGPLYGADIGVTDVQAAIAETGSLVCWSGPGRGRGLSLAPPLHIAMVRRSDIVADLIDYWPRHAAGGPLPSSIVLITGPSKTADIEGVLVTGVHGPREVHIVLVEDA